jgi:outer membrane protein assembly factor BamA
VKPRSGWAALPIASYSPETQLGLGAFATHFYRIGDASAETRPSSISAVGLYTLRNQLIVELIPEAYWDEQRWHVWSRLDYRRYPNATWAVGHDAPEDSEESYREDRVRWQARVDHELRGPLRALATLEAVYMELAELEAGGLLAREAIPGARGGRSVGLGPGLLWDTRDHLLTPRRGALYELSLLAYASPIGSEYDFGELLIDARRYLPLWADHVLALQLFAQVQFGSAPFYRLAQLGGQELLRGYFEGRFRDETLLALQAEYRLPLFWRFSGVVHAALGQVARDPSRLPSRRPNWSLGPGARIMLNTDERLNLRADLGVGPGTWGVYVGIAEAF